LIKFRASFLFGAHSKLNVLYVKLLMAYVIQKSFSAGLLYAEQESCIRLFAEKFNQAPILEAHAARKEILFSCNVQILSQLQNIIAPGTRRVGERVGETKYLSYVILLGAVVLFT